MRVADPRSAHGLPFRTGARAKCRLLHNALSLAGNWGRALSYLAVGGHVEHTSTATYTHAAASALASESFAVGRFGRSERALNNGLGGDEDYEDQVASCG